MLHEAKKHLLLLLLVAAGAVNEHDPWRWALGPDNRTLRATGRERAWLAAWGEAMAASGQRRVRTWWMRASIEHLQGEEAVGVKTKANSHSLHSFTCRKEHA